jgi:N-acetylglucosaminyl-diphospho-decaprenol L-rhamnosyltransferase
MATDGRAEDRRQFLRVAAPIYCRPARLRRTPFPVGDIGLGGMRVLTDEPSAVGNVLDIELLVGEQGTAQCTVAVAWVSNLPPGSAARFEVGLQFVSVPPGFLHTLAKIVRKEEPRVLVVMAYQGSTRETVDLAQAVRQGLQPEELVELAVITPADEPSATRELDLAIGHTELDGCLRHYETRSLSSLGEAYNTAIRRGLAAVTAPDFVYLLGVGIYPDKNSLRNLVDFMVTHNDVGIVGTRARGATMAYRPSIFRFPSASTDLKIGLRETPVTELVEGPTALIPKDTRSGETDWVTGGGMMVRHEVFDAVGVFDEALTGYFETADFCWRARQMGWQTHVVRQGTVAAASLPRPVTDEQAPHARLLWLASRQRFYLKHRGVLYLWLANLALALGLLGALLKRWLTRSGPRRQGTLSADVLRYVLRQRRSVK